MAARFCLRRSEAELDQLLGLWYKVLCLPKVRTRVARPRERSFIVTELPPKELGHGDHELYVLVKRGLDTPNAIRLIAKTLNVSVHTIGYAGLKDSQATTVQYLTLPPQATAKDIVVVRKGEKLAVLRRLRRGVAPLRRGMLEGNRFTILIELSEPVCNSIRESLLAYERLQLPNYYGYQRFGTRRPNTQLLGLLLARESPGQAAMEVVDSPYPDESPATISWRLYRIGHMPGYEAEVWKRITSLAPVHRLAPPPFIAKLALEALQSLAFNIYLSLRLEEYGAESLATPIKGEKQRNGQVLAPVPGRGIEPGGEARRLYMEALAILGVTPDVFRKVRGSWRSIAAEVTHPEAECRSDQMLILRFQLPPSAYATILLREIVEDPLLL